MKLFFVALCVWLSFVGALGAQSVGEVWKDRTGLYVHYADNANLLLRMDEHHFKMIFLDDKDTVRECPFKRVIVYVDRHRKKKYDMNLLLQPLAGTACLTHPRFIKPPLAFHVRIILCPNEEGDEGNITIPMSLFEWDGDKAE